MILNSEEAVRAFSRGGNVTIGGSISAAAGPIGTGGQVAASMVNPAPIFSYSRSKGEFAVSAFHPELAQLSGPRKACVHRRVRRSLSDLMGCIRSQMLSRGGALCSTNLNRPSPARQTVPHYANPLPQ